MGACYSRKAGGGKYTYSTVQMASTKLDDTSRLARPTPYTRNTSSPAVFTSRKSIPVSTKHDHSPQISQRGNTTPDLKNTKNSHLQQSSIPRFNSNISAIPVKTELNENIINSNSIKNDNSQLHFVNNNAVSSTPVASDTVLKQNLTHTVTATKHEKLNTSNKSCPDNMQGKGDEKSVSRIPAKLNNMGLPRSQLPQCVVKASHTISYLNSESDGKKQIVSEKQSMDGKSSGDSPTDSDVSKVSNMTSESHESIVDFDSGLGSSFIEKTKPEDSDTLKDIERLDLCDVSPTSMSEREHPQMEENKNLKSVEKTGLKYSMYKRGVNGKWNIDNKNFSSEIYQVSVPKSSEKNSPHQPNGENVFKISMPSNSFSTYASYKGLMSYKKYSSNIQPDSAISLDKSMKEKTNKNDINSGKVTVKDCPGSEKELNRKISLSQNRRNEKVNDANFPTASPSISPSSKQPSVDSDEKSDGLGSDTKSPVSEIENREFLIDDEISDQPELVCSFVNGKLSDSPLPSLQQSVTELHALQMSSTASKKADASSSKPRRDRIGSEHRDSLFLSSELGSSCSSIASDDLMMDFEKKMDFPDGTVNEGMASPMRKMSDLQVVEDQLSALVFNKTPKAEIEERARKRVYRRSSGPFIAGGSTSKEEWRMRSVSLPLRPPRPMSVSEADDGSIILDASSYRLLIQDLNSVKTLLLRLKSVIQEAETINPFDQNIFFQSLVHSDFPLSSFLSEKGDESDLSSKSVGLSVENADLRRQIVLLQQQLEEKDRTVHLLQQQMTKYANMPRYTQEITQSMNAATQTERPRSLTGSLTPSLNNSSETLVSSVQDAFEEHMSESKKEQVTFQGQMEQVSLSLSNLNQNLQVVANKYSYMPNRSFSSVELHRNSS